jgi:putative ABC transport system ATP-binding protein
MNMLSHPEPVVLSVRGVEKTFNRGKAGERRGLAGVDLTLHHGDFAIVIGSNGAGKSTLLSAIAGDFVPDAGAITIAGKDVTTRPVHQRAALVSRVFQDPMRGTAAGLTVEENLAIALRRGGRRSLTNAISARRRKIFVEALEPLGIGLEKRLDTNVDLLSGGQRQALSLVMAILIEPAVLVLDEHCAALDPRTAEAVMNATISAVRAARITTLMVTHNMQHAIDYGNRLIMMHEGRLEFEAGGEAKRALTIPSLVSRFRSADDKLLLVR